MTEKTTQKDTSGPSGELSLTSLPAQPSQTWLQVSRALDWKLAQTIHNMLKEAEVGAEKNAGAPVLDEDEAYEMVNLVPKLTGLPMTIWHSPKGRARHAARIKVNGVHGRHQTMEKAASVRLQPAGVVAGSLNPDDREKVFQWIAMNEAALLDYWNFTIDTDEFLARLRLLDARND